MTEPAPDPNLSIHGDEARNPVGATSSRPYPWAGQFIEIAMRAIRRVHFDYGPWSIGHQWKQEGDHHPELVNIGRGIELADEVSVCAAISAEFLTSQLVSGARIGGQNRFWEISREQKYTGSQQKVDLCLRRFHLDTVNGVLIEESPSIPAFIEAKRARRWTPEIHTGHARCHESQHAAVAADAEKLLEEKRKRNGEIVIHVLVWGILDTERRDESDYPNEFFSKVNKTLKPTNAQVVLHELRWLPLAWKPYIRNWASNSVVTTPPEEVHRWLWVSLAQVEQLTT